MDKNITMRPEYTRHLYIKRKNDEDKKYCSANIDDAYFRTHMGGRPTSSD